MEKHTKIYYTNITRCQEQYYGLMMDYKMILRMRKQCHFKTVPP